MRASISSMTASGFAAAAKVSARPFTDATKALRNSLRPTSLALILGVMIASCDGAPDREGSAANLSPEPDRLVTSLREVEGFWLVERFEDFEPSWRNQTSWRSAYVQIGNDFLTYNVGCNQSGNPAALGQDGILRDTGDGSRMQTLQGCGEVREARDGRFFAFFGSKPEVRGLGEGRILLRSDGRELILIRPNLWHRIHKPQFVEIEGRWVPQTATAYDGWGSEGFGLGDEPGVVTIGHGRITWSLCPDLPIPIRWTSDGRLAITASIEVTNCSAVARSTNNGPGAIMMMLTANPAVLRTGPDQIVLIDGSGEKGRRIDLRSEESVLNPPPPPPPPKGYKPPPLPPSPPATNGISAS